MLIRLTTRNGVLMLLAMLLASPGLAGFAGTDVFLPMVGRQAGIHPSNWYTTVWIHNPGAEAATARVYLLERGTSNPSPPFVDIAVATGGTEKLENVVETYFHVTVFGAIRVTCPAQVVVTSRVFSMAPGSGEKDSVGQDFAGVPASFAIGAGEKTQILGVHQTVPAASSEVRFNFGLVETTGHTATVRVSAYGDNGAFQGSTDVTVRAWSQGQWAFKDRFPAVTTENSRLDVEVISGSGKVIAYGSGITNGSQDPTTFEMAYPASVLGISTVAHDATLTGDGTAATPLGIAPSATAGQVLMTVAGGSPAPSEGAAALAGASVAWQSPASLSLGLTAGGVTFGNASGGLGQDAAALFWDNAGKRLGIGTATPHYQLELTGVLRLPRSAASGGSMSAGALMIGDYWFLHSFGSVSNTWVGPSAGNFRLTGSNNTGVGYGSLNDLTTGNRNTAVGSESLQVNTEGYANTAIGQGSLEANTTGFNNVAAGSTALSSNTTGEGNTAVGMSALHGNDDGLMNTALGFVALYSNKGGDQNSALGANALYSSTTAIGNTALGYSAMNKTIDGSHNTAVGELALWSNTSGGFNSALGSQALWANTSGSFNTGVGLYALKANISGGNNTAIGFDALLSNTGGVDNTAVGGLALSTADAGHNTAVGYNALALLMGGTANTAVGHSAGYSALGSGNVFLGDHAGYNEAGSNRLYIANSSASPLIYGQFDSKRVGIDATSPTQTLDINGGVRVRGLAGIGVRAVGVDENGVLTVASPSDARLKKEVAPLSESVDVLAALAGLRGVSYSWDTAQERAKGFGDRREIGLLAQDVEKVLPEVVSTGADGYRSVDYARLTALLVEVAKAQQRQIDSLKAEVAALRR